MVIATDARAFRRGQIVTVAVSGDYGKPRPAVIVQSNAFPDTHASVIVCQMTSTVQEATDYRVFVEPTAENGLRTPSQIMVDKPATIRRERIGRLIGSLDARAVRQLDAALAFVLGIAG